MFTGGRKREIPEAVSVKLCVQIALNPLYALHKPSSDEIEPHCRELGEDPEEKNP